MSMRTRSKIRIPAALTQHGTLLKSTDLKATTKLQYNSETAFNTLPEEVFSDDGEPSHALEAALIISKYAHLLLEIF